MELVVVRVPDLGQHVLLSASAGCSCLIIETPHVPATSHHRHSVCRHYLFIYLFAYRYH